jgi:hypothetical protein
MHSTEFHTSYREFSPSQSLARDLVCMWTQTVGARSSKIEPQTRNQCEAIAATFRARRALRLSELLDTHLASIR